MTHKLTLKAPGNNGTAEYYGIPELTECHYLQKQGESTVALVMHGEAESRVFCLSLVQSVLKL